MTSSFSAGFMSDHPFIENTLYTVNTWEVGSAESEKPCQRVSNADPKDFANPESF